MMHYWNYDLGYGMNPGFSLLGFIFQVFFWGLIIWLIIKLFKGSSSHCCRHDHEDVEEAGQIESENKNLEIIKERYAKGEITKKEFEQLKKDLS